MPEMPDNRLIERLHFAGHDDDLNALDIDQRRGSQIGWISSAHRTGQGKRAVGECLHPRRAGVGHPVGFTAKREADGLALAGGMTGRRAVLIVD